MTPQEREEMIRRFRRVPGEGPQGYVGPIDWRSTSELPPCTGTSIHELGRYRRVWITLKGILWPW